MVILCCLSSVVLDRGKRVNRTQVSIAVLLSVDLLLVLDLNILAAGACLRGHLIHDSINQVALRVPTMVMRGLERANRRLAPPSGLHGNRSLLAGGYEPASLPAKHIVALKAQLSMTQALCREQTSIRVRPARIYIDSRAWRDLLVAGGRYHVAPVGRVDVDDLA